MAAKDSGFDLNKGKPHRLGRNGIESGIGS